jgi:hypothetical protein
MNHGHSSVGLVASLVLAMAASGVHAQRDKIPPKDVDADFARIARDLPKDLASEAKRTQLARTVRRFVDLRIEANLLGYEKTPQFQKEFSEGFSQFEKILQSGRLTPLTESEAGDFGRESSAGFVDHEVEFRSFYDRVLSKDKELGLVSPEALRTEMVRFAAVLYGSNRKLWVAGRWGTWLFPICQPGGRRVQ